MFRGKCYTKFWSTFYDVSVGDVLSGGGAFSSDSYNVPWFATYGFNCWVRDQDPRELVGLNPILPQDLLPFLLSEDFMEGHESVFEDVEGWENPRDQFYTTILRFGLSRVTIVATGNYDPPFSPFRLHNFFQLMKEANAHRFPD